MVFDVPKHVPKMGSWLAGFWCSNSELQLQLQLNNKTEVMLIDIGTIQKLSSISVSTLQLESLFLTVKSRGVLLNSTLSMENFICQTCESYTCTIESVLSGSIFPMRLQWNWSPHSHCHASTTAVLYFLAGLFPLSTSIIAYRTVLLTSYWKNAKTEHISPLFQSLYWLPIQQRIWYKINTLCYKCSTHTALFYLCDCLQLYTPSRTLCSASDTLSLRIPRTRFPLLVPSLF